MASIGVLQTNTFDMDLCIVQGKDDAGYSALTTRMRHAKLTCQEILGMFQAR